MLARARRLAALKGALWPLLPPELQPRCELANLRGGTLVLLAENPTWATRLRLHSPRIIHIVRSQFKIDCRRVEVRVAELPAARRQRNRSREMSPTAREALARAARICRPDEDS